jgi:hypothetical protein
MSRLRKFLDLPYRIEAIFSLLAALINRINKLEEKLVAAKDELKAAIAAEKEQVVAAIAALEAKIGETLTADDLVELKAAIGGIYEPAEPPAEPPAEEVQP